MADPYLYPGTDVLVNRKDIRDAALLEQFERLATAQRMREGLPSAPLTAGGYRQLHRHLFQDVYDWAGKDRSVDISKGSSPFCRAQFVAPELNRRFAALKAESYLRGLKQDHFATRAGEHLSELNAIHPFREGNGRTMRAFLVRLGHEAGHHIELARIEPRRWNEASRESFRTADSGPMRDVIKTAITERARSRDIERERHRDDGRER